MPYFEDDWVFVPLEDRSIVLELKRAPHYAIHRDFWIRKTIYYLDFGLLNSFCFQFCYFEDPFGLKESYVLLLNNVCSQLSYFEDPFGLKENMFFFYCFLFFCYNFFFNKSLQLETSNFMILYWSSLKNMYNCLEV